MLFGLLAGCTAPALAQTTITLNGNERSIYNQNYSSNGSLTIDLGVFSEFLVVGGGGGGGGSNGGGGGGGGGVLSGNATLGPSQSHAVVVGAGGSGGANSSNATLRRGSNGGNSSFSGVNALGGGGGGPGGGGTAGSVGASGGGGGGRNSASGGLGTSGQGFAAGRAGSSSSSNYYGGGGGGGAGGAGGNGSGDAGVFSTARGGNGGAGVTRNISGGNVTYGGGGGGGAENSGGGGESAGSGNGGGGSGSTGSGNTGSSGAANRGGGGGGAGNGASGGSGGSGTVIVRYLGNQMATGGTVSSSSGYTIHSFNETGGSTLDFGGQNLANLEAYVFGDISSAGEFTYSSPGTLKVQGFVQTGDITVEQGTFSLCTGEINQGGYLGTYDPTVLAKHPMTGTMMATVLFDKNISNNGTIVLYAGGGLQNRLTGNISGTGGITIGCFPGYEDGTVVLSGDNTFTGETTVNAGTLMLEGDNRLASSSAVNVSSSASLYLDGDQVIGRFVCGGTLNMKDSLLAIGSSPADSSSMGGYMMGTGMLSVANGSDLSMNGLNAGGYLGDFVCGPGSSLAISSNSTLNSGSVVTLNGGALELEGDIVVGYLENNGGTITGGNVTNALTLVESGTVTTTITDGGNYDAGILKQGATTATVNAAQEFTGVVKVQEGTLALGSNGSFDASASVMTYDGAKLDFNDQSQTVSAINGSGGTVDLGTGTLTVNCSTTNSTYGGTITGTGGVVKDGAETLTLSGANTYSGNTTVTEGTFLVDGSANNTQVTVQSGATAGGSGSVGGLILQSGGTVDASGSMNVVGNATFAAGANYDWSTTTGNADSSIQTDAGTAWELMDVGGTLTFTGAAPGSFNLNLTSLTGGTEAGVPAGWDPNVGSTWLIASADGGIFFNSTLVTANRNYTSFFNIDTTGWTATLPAQGFRVVTLDDTMNLYLQAPAAVPEPGQIAASLLLLAGIGGYVWRKRRATAKTVQAAN